MITFIILTTIFDAAFGQITIEAEKPTLFNIDAYREKICKSEPTCKLIENTSKEFTTLNIRNCMCDEECAVYGDCCLDSKYYKKEQQKENFDKYQCSFVERIYMKTECPSNYNDKNLKMKCEKSMLPLDTEDTKLIVPVTSTKSRITYGNEYCARCHGEEVYQAWNLTSFCSIALNEYIERDDFKQNYPLANLDNDTSSMMNPKSPSYRVENLADLTENSTLAPVLNDLLEESENAANYIKFDASTKTFRSTYNGKNFTCSYGRIAPKNLESYLRPCQLIISKCSGKFNQTQEEKCRSYTSIVFDNYAAYRNQDCAVCNGVLKNLPGCFSLPPAFSAASTLFSTQDKVSGAPCSNSAVKNKFC